MSCTSKQVESSPQHLCFYEGEIFPQPVPEKPLKDVFLAGREGWRSQRTRRQRDRLRDGPILHPTLLFSLSWKGRNSPCGKSFTMSHFMSIWMLMNLQVNEKWESTKTTRLIQTGGKHPELFTSSLDKNVAPPCLEMWC